MAWQTLNRIKKITSLASGNEELAGTRPEKLDNEAVLFTLTSMLPLLWTFQLQLYLKLVERSPLTLIPIKANIARVIALQLQPLHFA